MPAAEAHEGSAESIPLPGESVDAVFAGQAFHWFDREQALPEIHRVIGAGGGLALLWNWWDERDPLQHELGGLIGYAGHEPYRDEELPGEPWFREVGRPWSKRVWESSPDALVGYLSTTSMFVTMEADGARPAAGRGAATIAARHGDRFPLPRLTYVFAFERLW